MLLFLGPLCFHAKLSTQSIFFKPSNLPCSQVSKLRLRDLTQNHTVGEWQSQRFIPQVFIKCDRVSDTVLGSGDLSLCGLIIKASSFLCIMLVSSLSETRGDG